MRIEFNNLIQFFKKYPWIADVLAAIGGIYYFLQSYHFAHYIDLTMDEGTYLVKGLLFASGQYRPFQYYGPWTHKMPLAYLLPGFIETVFGPGLRTGRYLSLAFGILLMIGTWMLIKRLSGHWWAAFGIWILAFGIGNIISYSQAITQPIVAALLVWALVFALGRKQPLWKIAIGSLLGISIFLLRQDMLPFAVFLTLYIFWEHGKRPGFIALGITAAVFIAIHIIYWPNILAIYTFLPAKLTPFLNPWRAVFNDPGIATKSIDRSALGNLFNLINAYRYNLLAVIGGVFSILFLPGLKKWKEETIDKSIIFLWGTFIVLIFVHMLAAFGFESYRVSSFLFRYMAFFGILGLIIFVVTFSKWNREDNLLKVTLSTPLTIITPILTFLGAYQIVSDPIMNIKVPRTRNMQILPGSTELWRALSNKFHLTYENLQLILPAAFGLCIGILIVASCVLVTRKFHKRGIVSGYGHSLLVSMILFGIVLAPTQLLNSNVISDQCEFDVIQANEQVGNYLNQIIPSGSLVYWDSNNSPVPLLYLDDLKVFPPQLDQIWNFNIGGDPDMTYKYGFWNQQLADQWMYEADFLLITDDYVSKYTRISDFSTNFDEIEPIKQTIGCRDKSIIHIYQKVQ